LGQLIQLMARTRKRFLRTYLIFKLLFIISQLFSGLIQVFQSAILSDFYQLGKLIDYLLDCCTGLLRYKEAEYHLPILKFKIIGCWYSD